MSIDSKFYELTNEYLMKFLELNPILATYLGIHIYDSQMPRGDKQGIMEIRKLLEDFENALLDINYDKLSFEAKIDYKVIRDVIRLQLFRIDEWPIWRMFPFAAENIGDALFPLFVREFAPFSDRFSSIISRIEKSPKYIRESMECLEDPVRIYIDIALEAARQLPMFLDVILSSGRELIGEESELVERGKIAIESLNNALSDYVSWLEDKRSEAKESFAIGREKFKKLLEIRGIDLSLEEILRIGEDYLRRFKEELARLANEIAPGKSVNEVRNMIESEHPKDFNEALNEYRKAIEEAKKFIIEKGIAPIPKGEEIKVIQTPSFLLPVIPFAAYFPPAPFDEEKLGVYIVTPPLKPEHIKRHNYYSIHNTSVHEAYPGHHLQLSWSATKRNLIRILSQPTEFIEGWAHYCEDLMKEYGYRDTPKHRFVQLVDAVWRAVRIIIDVKLSTEEMSFDEAVDFLVRETGMDREAAIAEVKRYTYTPGYQLSYLLGKHLIQKLRDEVREKFGDKYSDYRFHEILLQSGGLPYKYLRELVFEKMKM